MNFKAAREEVLNRGSLSVAFLIEMAEWGRTASAAIFAPRPSPIGKPDPDIYARIKPILGPWQSLLHRIAAMLEVMRVLALLESSGDWTDGVDTSRLGDDTPENEEAGAWQVSYDARNIGQELRDLLAAHNIAMQDDGVRFQQHMKFNHPLAMEFIARLMRLTWEHNGPLYRGDERLVIRKTLRGERNSIYPWLSRESVAEFQAALAPRL